MARGLERRKIFKSEEDRHHWRDLLASLPERFGVRIHAWVAMENHCHLQVETPEANLSRALQWLNVSYAVWYNRKHQRVGPLFCGRFKAELTDTDMWVAEVNRYIHLNPVRTSEHGLSKKQQANAAAGQPAELTWEAARRRLAQMREYRWSSCRAYLGLEQAPGWMTVDAVRSTFGGRTRKEPGQSLPSVSTKSRGPWVKGESPYLPHPRMEPASG